MNFDPLNIADWIKHQVKLDAIPDATVAAEIERHCLALARTGLPECYRHAERPELFWRGITRGNRNATAELEGDDQDDDGLGARLLRCGDRPYHPLLRNFLAERGVDLVGFFPVTPEEVAFVLAGGSVASTADGHLWQVHHAYNGALPFEGRVDTLQAHDEGDHFTQAAGLVAVRAGCEQFINHGSVLKTLRWVAFETFNYDPDHYFVTDAGAHDHFGFLRNPPWQVV